MQIEFSKPTLKYLKACDKPTKRRLKAAIEKLPSGDVKRLQGYQSEYRLRVGDLRIIFSMTENTVIVNDILPRGQVYKRLQEGYTMSKEMLHSLIDMLPDADTNTIYQVLIRFIPSDIALPDEREAIENARKSILEEGTVPIDEIDWD